MLTFQKIYYICFIYMTLLHLGTSAHIILDHNKEANKKEVSLDCTTMLYELYNHDALHYARMIRKEWKRLAPFYIYETQIKYVDSRTNEREFQWGHTRFDMLGPVNGVCKFPFEKYGKGDEEKRSCGLHHIQNKVSKCIIYSIGSKNQWSFEQAIYQYTSCQIETFDCNVAEDAHPPENIKDRTRLHRVCLGEKDEYINGKQFLSWTSLNTLVGIQSAPTFLKMDIEGFEYTVLKSIISSGVQMPLQIALEMHTVSYTYNWPGRMSSAVLFSFMGFLEEFGGYYLIDRHDNPECLGCTEVVLAKLDCNPSLSKKSRHEFGTYLRNQTDEQFGIRLLPFLGKA